MSSITLIAVAISIFAFASQNASALTVQDSNQGSGGLSKRKSDNLASSSDLLDGVSRGGLLGGLSCKLGSINGHLYGGGDGYYGRDSSSG
jgi:hypothetical protein